MIGRNRRADSLKFLPGVSIRWKGPAPAPAQCSMSNDKKSLKHEPAPNLRETTMRVNKPVTGRERTYGDDVEINSVTDLKGVITYVNKHFCDVAGFTPEELVGKPHNIIRHPDMPEAAFADMWKHLKATRPWLGLLKNRCKNGDHYWVKAYVMPMYQGGEVVGYESIRTRPPAAAIARAERAYRALRGGRAPAGRFRQSAGSRFIAGSVAAVLPAAVTGIAASDYSSSAVIGAVVSLAAAALVSSAMQRPLRRLAGRSRALYDNSLTSQVLSGRCDEFGQIETAINVLEARRIRFAGSTATSGRCQPAGAEEFSCRTAPFSTRCQRGFGSLDSGNPEAVRHRRLIEAAGSGGRRRRRDQAVVEPGRHAPPWLRSGLRTGGDPVSRRRGPAQIQVSLVQVDDGVGRGDRPGGPYCEQEEEP